MSIFIFNEYRDRTVNDVVQDIGFVTGIDNDTLRGIVATVAMFQESIQGGDSGFFAL
mgnify:CR=1 FL=1